jgi:hypothetical protein
MTPPRPTTLAASRSPKGLVPTLRMGCSSVRGS